MDFSIVIDDDYGDSAAPIIAKTLARVGLVKVLDASEIITAAGYYFMPATGFLAHDPQRQTRDLSKTYVVNRVVQIGDATAARLGGHGDVLHANVVLGTYSRIISNAAKVFGSLEHYPACQVLPINMQWRRLQRASVDVRTPAFVYARSAHEPDVSGLINPMQKDPFDIYNWRPQESQRSRSDMFVVDRPAGRPLISYFIGSATNCFSLLPGEHLSNKLLQSVANLTADVSKEFAAFMGEFLIFENKGVITFAAFSRYLLSSITDAEFASVVQRGFTAALETT